MMRNNIKSKFIIILALLCMLLCGCVNTASVVMPEATLPPEATPVPTPSPTPAPEVELDMAELSSVYDALGEYISSEDHFERYITFEGIQVYEQCEDTFMDAIAVSEYPDTLVCAVNITFFDEEDAVIAQSRVQTRDGQYVLKLEPGKNTIFAQIDSDIVLTDKEFKLEFSDELSVLPG